ncbi:MAG: ATP-binding protein [bacterium]
MTEHQNIEYKQSWRDDYLKWVCGFANASGGTIYIGKDDNGKIIGVSDHKNLMENLPNKVHDILGVVAEVNLRKSGKLYFIEIVVPSYSVPISYRGRYYYRTGSIKRELTGSALNEFLLKKTGQTWDEVIEPRAKLSDIDKKSVQVFLKSAAQSKRFPADEKLPLKELLAKLQLMEKGKLKRAALVLFGREPMRFFPSMFVRIGRFGESKVDLRFQESIEGNLIYCLHEAINQLDHKFLISPVSFEGLHRIEKWQYPLPALREVLLNALIHRNYIGAHIQIEVYNDKICFWNDGGLPEELTIDLLRKPHSSRPRNPIIADVCFKGGYIDAWGRGIEKIINACKEAKLPEPEFEENSGGMLVTLFARRDRELQQGDAKTPQVTEQVTGEAAGEVTGEAAGEVTPLLMALNTPLSRKELQEKLGLKGQANFRERYLEPVLASELVEMTQPDSPKSPTQKYRLTEKGKKYLKKKGTGTF